jgi:hypothetical protein
MTEDYVVRDDEVDLMHDVRTDMSLEDLIDAKIAQIVGIAEEQNRELQKLIDFILHPHSHEEIIAYAENLKHQLEEN